MQAEGKPSRVGRANLFMLSGLSQRFSSSGAQSSQASWTAATSLLRITAVAAPPSELLLGHLQGVALGLCHGRFVGPQNRNCPGRWMCALSGLEELRLLSVLTAAGLYRALHGETDVVCAQTALQSKGGIGRPITSASASSALRVERCWYSFENHGHEK